MSEINIYMMDCLEGMKKIPDESVDLILTDPPYGINFKSNWTQNHHYIINDNFADWVNLIPLWLKEFKRIIKPTGVVCLFSGGGGVPVNAILTIESVKHFNLIQTLIWKKSIGLGWRYRSSYENILILSKDKNNYNFYDKSLNLSNVIEGINRIIPQKYDHPTPKPIKLMDKLIKIHSKEGDMILDPFMGGGTTAISCIRLNRVFIGFERDEDYFKMASQRIETQKSQKRLNTLFSSYDKEE